MKGKRLSLRLASLGLLFAFFYPGFISVRAQSLVTSPAYPLQAHIIKVETRTGSHGTSDVYNDSDGNVHGGGGGGTYQWHLMKAVIGDTLYGLSVSAGVALYGVVPLQHRDWLEIGTYPAKRVKSGFEFQYLDNKGKLRHEVLHVESEEPAPATEPTPTSTSNSETPKEKP